MSLVCVCYELEIEDDACEQARIDEKEGKKFFFKER